MGTGEHGGFGHTSGSSKSNIFTRVQYEGTVTVGDEVRNVSRRVYQRNDIDFSYVDPDTGLTNLQIMKKAMRRLATTASPSSCITFCR